MRGRPGPLGLRARCGREGRARSAQANRLVPSSAAEAPGLRPQQGPAPGRGHPAASVYHCRERVVRRLQKRQAGMGSGPGTPALHLGRGAATLICLTNGNFLQIRPNSQSQAPKNTCFKLKTEARTNSKPGSRVLGCDLHDLYDLPTGPGAAGGRGSWAGSSSLLASLGVRGGQSRPRSLAVTHLLCF